MDKTIDELEAIRLRDLSICLKKAVALSDLKDVEYLSDIIIDCDNKVKKYEMSSRCIVKYTKTELGKFSGSVKTILKSHFNLGNISYEYLHEIDWEKDQEEYDIRHQICIDRNESVNKERERLFAIVDKTEFSEQLIIARILLGRKSQCNERNCLEISLADSIRTEIITEFINKNSNYKPNKTI